MRMFNREKWSLPLSSRVVVQKSKEAVEVNVFLNKTTSVAPILNISLVVHWTNVAQNVLVLLTCILALAVRDYCMHSILCIFTFLNQVRSHSWCHHIRDVRSSFREVGSKVHFFPSVFLLQEFHPREAEVLTNTSTFHEVYHTILLKIEVLMGSE